MQLTTFLKIWMLVFVSTMFVCMLATTIGNQWVELNYAQPDGKTVLGFTNGLWKECTDDNGNGLLCRDVLNQPEWMIKDGSWLEIVRALICSGCVVAFVSVISTAFYVFQPKLGVLAIYSSLLAGCLVTAGLIIFHRDNNWVDKFQYEYGWTFDIGIASTVFAALTFILGLLISVFVQDKDIKDILYKRHKDEESIPNVC